MRTMLKSKIQGAIVTTTRLDYDGSIMIDAKLMRKVDILPYEKVEVMNINTGARFETYAIEGGEHDICLNGAAARLGAVGDKLIILAYAIGDVPLFPKIINVEKKGCYLDEEDNGSTFTFPPMFDIVKTFNASRI